MEDQAQAVGKIILGSGVLLAIYAISPIPPWELFLTAGYVLFPILAACVALGFISFGTFELIWNTNYTKEFSEMVDKYVKEERNKRAAA